MPEPRGVETLITPGFRIRGKWGGNDTPPSAEQGSSTHQFYCSILIHHIVIEFTESRPGSRRCTRLRRVETPKAYPTGVPHKALRLALRLLVYVVLFIATAFFASPLLLWVLSYPAGAIAAEVFAAIVANWLTLRIWEDRRIFELGLWWTRQSSENLAIGLLGGAGSASLVLAPPILLGIAHIVSAPNDYPTVGSIVLVTLLLSAGVVGEELLFRGYGFQVLLAAAGPFATILPVGVIFALLHGSNPNATTLGIANTAAFGILFGYAYLRSRDLWLPIGLHLGWNFTLPLFGVNLSGFKMKMAVYEMSWSAGDLWSGGEYGPEASILTSAVIVLLAFYLWKAPIRWQPSTLTDPPAENPVCEPSARLPL